MNDRYLRLVTDRIDKYFREVDDFYENCEIYKEIKRYADNGSSIYKKKAKQLLEQIEKIKKAPSVCKNEMELETLNIGLYGSWGSGKTYALKYIESKYFENEKIIPVFFNAWRFEKEEHIILPFFENLVNTVSLLNKKTLKEDLEIIYISLLDGMEEFINSFNLEKSLFQTIKSALKGFSKTKLDDVKEVIENPAKSIYSFIPEAIKITIITHNVRFLFLIDDLDRCLPENALKILESIKLFFDVPGCAFVIGIDDYIIDKAVELHYKEYEDKPINGYEYLEKIITLPVKIPKNEDIIAREFLLKNYKNIFVKVIYKDDSNEEIIDTELLNFFIRVIHNVPRKLIRACELYEFKEKLIRESCDKYDRINLAKIVFLELFFPKLYSYMQKGFKFNRLYNLLVTIRSNDKIKSLKNIEIIKDIRLLKEEENYEFNEIKKLLEEFVKSRNELNIDKIFDKPSDFEKCCFTLNNKKIEEYGIIENEERFFEYLFSDDEVKIKSAFDEFLKYGIYLERSYIDEIINRLNDEFYKSKNLVYWIEKLSNHLKKEDLYYFLHKTDFLKKVYENE
ncbi:KAP family P-loop NTPase fold protein [Caminibacter pacificus]